MDGISLTEGIILAIITLINGVAIAILNNRQTSAKAEIESEASVMRERTNAIIKTYELINNQVDRAKEELAAAEEIRGKLSAELQVARAVRRSLERELNDLRTRVRLLEEALDRVNVEKAELRDRVAHYERREQELLVKVEKLRSELKKYTDTNGNHRLNI